MRRAFIIVVCVLLGAAAAAFALAGPLAAGAAAPTSCRAAQWCTITSNGISNAVAAQFAIGNVPRGTALAVTQNEIKYRQIGGQIVDGEMAGTCAWSQYQRDWAPLTIGEAPRCANPGYLNSQFIADDGAAIWSGCHPRCWGGVPLHFDPRCGKGGRTFCYSSNCEEYANFFPWTRAAHPLDPLRDTARHLLAVRYLARYGDVWTNSPFYLVMDTAVGHGQANWVFVSGRGCGIVTGPTGSYHTTPRHY
jgi:hypothetical protein